LIARLDGKLTCWWLPGRWKYGVCYRECRDPKVSNQICSNVI